MTEYHVADVELMLIEFRIGARPELLLLLAADGTVNRMGKDRKMYVGLASPSLLPEALRPLTDEMLTFMGNYDLKEKHGPVCSLTIAFQFKGAGEAGFAFSYGMHSQGPPEEIGMLVEHAVRVSEPWYQEQQRMAGKNIGPAASARPKRRWWPFS
jgi:hypothetical protein